MSDLNSVLVVDDDPRLLELLKMSVMEEGCDVVAVLDPRQALEHVRKTPFAVIFSDQNMGSMNGLEFLAEARKIQPDASQILITGVLTLDLALEAINRGEIFRFIAKPWVHAELMATLKNALARCNLLRANRRLQEETAALNQQLADVNSKLQEKVFELAEQKIGVDRAFGELKLNFDHSLEICHRMLSSFHPALGTQVKAVVEICKRMAASGRLTEAEGHTLTVSAWLYDIGLIGLPRRLWRRMHSPKMQATLTEEERQALYIHPVHGQSLAAFVARLKPVGETIRGHHERFDGKGYPDGLEGEMIPWTARCLAVAVYFVETGLPPEEAASAVLERSGSWFDPEAVRLILRVMQGLAVPKMAREVMLDELEPGMALAHGLYSSTGVLIFPEEQRLNDALISKIKKHHMLNTITQRLLVYG